MNQFTLIPIRWKQLLALAGLLWAACLFTGCQHLYYADPNPEKPFVFPGQTTAPAVVAAVPAPLTTVGVPQATPATTGNLPPLGIGTTAILRPGEQIKVIFSDLPPPGLQELPLRIGENGKVTLYLNVTVQAAGKTAGQLQEDIRKEYVPRYFKVLTVTVKTEERFYYVGGEVRMPDRRYYAGQMTVSRAVDTAGGFTDFSNRKKIELHRADGQKFVVNWYKARDNPKLDLEVFPNDHVIVPKRLY